MFLISTEDTNLKVKKESHLAPVRGYTAAVRRKSSYGRWQLAWPQWRRLGWFFSNDLTKCFQPPSLVQSGFLENLSFFVNVKRDLISQSSFITRSKQAPRSSADAGSAGWAGQLAGKNTILLVSQRLVRRSCYFVNSGKCNYTAKSCFLFCSLQIGQVFVILIT